MSARKLPVIETVKASYVLAWKNIAQYSHFISGWLLVSAPIIYFWFLEFAPFLSEKCYIEDSVFVSLHGVEITFGIANHFFYLISATAGMIVYCSLMVLFSQFLLGKKRESKLPYLLLDDVVWQSFKFPMRIAVYLLILGILGVLITAFLNFGLILVAVLGLIFVVLVVLYWPKLLIAMVAIANGYKGVTLEDAIDKTESNTFRVIGGAILYYIPVLILGFLVGIILDAENCEASFTNAALLTIEALILMYVANLLSITYYTLCYQHFYEGKKISEIK